MSLICKEFHTICKRLFLSSDSFLKRARMIHNKLLRKFEKSCENKQILNINHNELNQLSILGVHVIANVSSGIFFVTITTLWHHSYQIERKLCFSRCEIINQHCIDQMSICFHLRDLLYDYCFKIKLTLSPIFDIQPYYKPIDDNFCKYFDTHQNFDDFQYFPNPYDLTQLISVTPSGIKRIHGEKIVNDCQPLQGGITKFSNNFVINQKLWLLLHLNKVLEFDVWQHNHLNNMFHHTHNIISLTNNIILGWCGRICNIFCIVQNSKIVLIGSYTAFNKSEKTKVVHDTKDHALIFIEENKVSVYDLSILKLY